jgi:hypothetical protein
MTRWRTINNRGARKRRRTLTSRVVIEIANERWNGMDSNDE